jgi:hypothetical protein
MHVVREERLAGGGVSAGDDPVVGTGFAAVAGQDWCEDLARGLKVLDVLRGGEAALGFVEGDVGDVGLGSGEVDGGLGGRVVAPGAYGVEVGYEVEGETGGEGFAV